MTARSQRRKPTPVLEWILGLCGSALLIAGLGYLVLQELHQQDTVGAVLIQTNRVGELDEGYVVQFTAHNTGSQTLAGVQISARVYDGTTELESVRASIDHLPGESRRGGGIYLQHDPRRYRLELRAEGFQEP